MKEYKKPGSSNYEITGEVETLNASNNSVDILISKGREPRKLVNISMPENMVKQFIPYLYVTVKAKFINGSVFITPN